MLRRDRPKIDAVSASLTLAKYGFSMLRAKRALEAVLERGEVRVRLPTVDFVLDVVRELRKSGIHAVRLASSQHYDLARKLREMRERLKLTQEQFALKFGFETDALQNWEQGRRAPSAIAAYIRVIEKDPEGAAQAQEEQDERSDSR